MSNYPVPMVTISMGEYKDLKRKAARTIQENKTDTAPDVKSLRGEVARLHNFSEQAIEIIMSEALILSDHEAINTFLGRVNSIIRHRGLSFCICANLRGGSSQPIQFRVLHIDSRTPLPHTYPIGQVGA